MRRDRVTAAEVEISVFNPDFSRDQLCYDGMESWKKFGQRFIKVIHKKEGQDEIIITVIVKKKPALWTMK